MSPHRSKLRGPTLWLQQKGQTDQLKRELLVHHHNGLIFYYYTALQIWLRTFEANGNALALDNEINDYHGLSDAQSYIRHLQSKHGRKWSFWKEADYPAKPEQP
ncbi:hypothetical protein [Marinobacter sp. LV10MA510-1]|uniref:hypothetical protein n=1 Tax=Marinobacter sp. LV10MA510-1 TaxID=1415567 RepID=UPI000BF57B8F|nr:hypothetical protein [Marinobacter sp. LV10MA510-1]